MTTLSRQYKLSKNILFYILQRHRSEQGKVVTIFRRGSERGEGVMLSNMTSKNKFIMLNIPLFLNCCQKNRERGVKCPTVTSLYWNVNPNYIFICIIWTWLCSSATTKLLFEYLQTTTFFHDNNKYNKQQNNQSYWKSNFSEK
jgi:hypothetical protein